LASFLDEFVVGRVVLHVTFMALPVPAEGEEGGGVVVCEGGVFSYRLVIRQVRVDPPPLAYRSALLACLRVADGVSERCMSLAFFQGMRRAAVKKLSKDGAKGSGTQGTRGFIRRRRYGSPLNQAGRDRFTQESVGVPADGGDLDADVGGGSRWWDLSRASGDRVGARRGCTTSPGDNGAGQGGAGDFMDIDPVGTAGVTEAGSSRNEESGPPSAPVIKMVMLYGPPPPAQEFSYSFSLSSDLVLRSKVTHVREAGRLHVVADVREVVLDSSDSDA